MGVPKRATSRSGRPSLSASSQTASATIDLGSLPPSTPASLATSVKASLPVGRNSLRSRWQGFPASESVTKRSSSPSPSKSATATAAPPEVNMPSTSALLPWKTRVWCVSRAPAFSAISSKRMGGAGFASWAASGAAARSRTNQKRLISLLPQRGQIGVHPLVGIELIVDVFFQVVAVAGEAGLELRIAGEELIALAPGRLGLLRLLGLPVAVAEGDPGPDVNLSLLGLGFRHRPRLLQVRDPQRRAAEDLGPVEIAVAPRVEGDPALLELDRLREVGQGAVGQDHLGDRAGVRDLVHVGVAVVEPGEGGLRMAGRELAVEVDGAVILLGADDGLAILVRILQVVRIGVERGLEQRQRRGVVVSGDGLHGVVELGGVEGRRGEGGEQKQGAEPFDFFLGSTVKGFGSGSPSTSR